MAIAALSSLALGLSACGSGSSSNTTSSASSSSSTTMDQMAGVSATGDLGKEPKVSFHTPMTVQNNTYEILQQGDGAALQEGDRVCTQGIALNAEDGSELMNTWTKNTPDCSLVITKQSTNEAYYNLLKGQKLNSTIAFGVNDSNSEGTSYILALTLVSREKALTKATGDKVTDVPSNLPKVTLASNGKPSLDMNGYQPGSDLVAQTLIKGKGAAVTETSTVSANYSGWYVQSDGTLKQFDSSWDQGAAASFSLAGGVLTGWTKGLTGQTVGSQVLLVIPPADGYGSTDKTDSSGNVVIPANSTLYFVVDILYAY